MSTWTKMILLITGVFYAIAGMYLAYAATIVAGEELLGRATLFAIGSAVMVALATWCGVALWAASRLPREATGATPETALDMWVQEMSLPRRPRFTRARRWTTAQKEAMVFAILWLASLIAVTVYGVRDGDTFAHLALVWAISIAVYAVLIVIYLLPEIVRRRERGF